ncbi:MAG: hypothetical protein ACI8S6_003899 [Myxococcota bacterium]|jgi:hypothetical protein
MRSNKKQPKNTDRQVRTMRTPDASARDPGSRQLQRVSRKLGNSDFSAQVQDNSQKRDHLLAFITKRLETLGGVQNTERLEIKDQRQWFKEVAKGTDGYHLPDTTRWHEAARRYKRAATALAGGDLTRGAQLLEQALEAERTAYGSTPRQVREELDEHERSAAATPDELPHAINGGRCPEIGMPTEIRHLADRILSVRNLMEDSPPLPLTRWWDESIEEEEEEEEEDGD